MVKKKPTPAKKAAPKKKSKSTSFGEYIAIFIAVLLMFGITFILGMGYQHANARYQQDANVHWTEYTVDHTMRYYVFWNTSGGAAVVNYTMDSLTKEAAEHRMPLLFK